MKREGFYTSGEFAKKAHVSVRTIRFYDKQNILKPTDLSDSGTRFYTDADFARLQQVLLLKYLGFSLDEIKSMTINDSDYNFLLSSLKLQQKLVQDKIEQLQLVSQAISNTSDAISQNHSIDWSQMLDLIHLTGMENSLQTQYQNANNISARISLHQRYSTGTPGWFPWIYSQCRIQPGMRILEIGCGSGAIWNMNKDLLPERIHVVLSDISEGMLRDARRNLLANDQSLDTFSFKAFDCNNIPYKDHSFDIVIANHVLFYCDDVSQVCSEISRVLKPNGHFICSTYSSRHMKEINELVQEFDDRITLSADKLYTIFGLDNGTDILSPFFAHVEKRIYQDSLVVDKAEPLIEYIMSCHGNQNQYLIDRYNNFRSFMIEKTHTPLTITKEAGIFICSAPYTSYSF